MRVLGARSGREHYQLAYQLDHDRPLPMLLYARASLKLNYFADARHWLRRVRDRNLRVSPQERIILEKLEERLAQKTKPPETGEGY